jgi:four helix bundle protein
MVDCPQTIDFYKLNHHRLWTVDYSCSEVKSMLYLGNRLDYISIEVKDKLINDSNEVSKIIRGLIKSLYKKN